MINNEASSLLAKKKLLLKSALEITERQSGMIGNEDVEPLIASLDERQRVYNEVNEVDDAISSLIGDYKQYPGFQPQFDEISELLSRISSIDEANNKKAASLMAELRGNMKRINDGRIQNRSYERQISFGASYFDQSK